MITLGLWPIAGVTTIGVTPGDAMGTIQTAIDEGITAFDSAFSYGYDGESDRYLGRAIAGRRDEFTVMNKVGQRWDSERNRIVDGTPKQLTADAETSLKRMGIDSFDLLYLHSPDPKVAIETSAQCMEDLRSRGLCRQVGVCNVDLDQLEAFCTVAKCDAIQCPLNLIQSDSLQTLIPRCEELGVSVHVFWTLMKGMLAGKIGRDHQFAKGDSRPNYPIFQGEARLNAHRIVDGLKRLGDDVGMTVAQLSVGWAVSQPGVTSALVGARRPEQIRELASAQRLTPSLISRIQQCVDAT